MSELSGYTPHIEKSSALPAPKERTYDDVLAHYRREAEYQRKVYDWAYQGSRFKELYEAEDRMRDAEFFLAVEQHANKIKGLDLEALHKIYGEGQARLVYEAMARQNIRVPWIEAAQTFEDRLGVKKAIMVHTLPHISRDFWNPQKVLHHGGIYHHAADQVERKLEEKNCFVRYGDKQTRQTVDIPGYGQIEVEIDGYVGAHYALTSSGFEDPQLMSLKVSDGSSLIMMENKHAEDPYARLLTLAHEAGHENEKRFPPTKGMDSKTGQSYYFPTEYQSTLLPLQVAMLLNRVTADPKLAEKAAIHAALYNWVVLGDPKRCRDRRNQAKGSVA